MFKIDNIILMDLDGVVYFGSKVAAGACEAMAYLRNRKLECYFVTNNSTQTRRQYVSKLKKMGIAADAGHIITSAYATAGYIAKNFPDAKVYVVGEHGLKYELKRAGIALTSPENADTVVAGLDRKLDYGKISDAATVARRGRFIATNTDATFPVENGLLPGSGAGISAIACASRNPDVVIGKPNRHIFEPIETIHGHKNARYIVVGDRYETDIAFAMEIRAISVFVEDSPINKLAVEPAKFKHLYPPDYTIRTIAGLPRLLEKIV